MNRRTLLIICIISVYAISAQQNLSYAQTKLRLRLVDQQTIIDAIEWSNDSRYFYYAYQNASVGSDYMEATVYPATNILVRSQVLDLGFTKNLSTEEKLLFQIGSAQVSISPNNRYAVFVSPNSHTFIIGDRQTRTLIDTKIVGDSSDFNIIWNSIGSAFVPVLSSSGFPGGFYTGFSQNLSLLKTSQIGQFSIGDMIFDILQSKQYIYQVSKNGIFILGKASGNTPNAAATALVMINGLDTNQSRLIASFTGEQELLTGSFSPYDENKVLAVTKNGLVEYSTIRSESKVLDEVLNTDWATNAVFSPDGKWLAVVHNTTQDGAYLYLAESATFYPDVATSTPISTTKLQLSSICPANSTEFQSWNVQNPNLYSVSFTWNVVGTQQQGSEVIAAKSSLIFKTQIVQNNVVRILVNGVLQDEKSGGNVQCSVTATPKR